MWGEKEKKKKKKKKEKIQKRKIREKERNEGRVHSKEIDRWFVSEGVGSGVVKKSLRKKIDTDRETTGRKIRL